MSLPQGPKIPRPHDRNITSVDSFARWLKDNDPNETWLESNTNQNKLYQQVRSSASRCVDKTCDGQYATTWVKTPLIKKTMAIAALLSYEPRLGWFEDNWPAELFLSFHMKNNKVRRGRFKPSPFARPTADTPGLLATRLIPDDIATDHQRPQLDYIPLRDGQPGPLDTDVTPLGNPGGEHTSPPFLPAPITTSIASTDSSSASSQTCQSCKLTRPLGEFVGKGGRPTKRCTGCRAPKNGGAKVSTTVRRIVTGSAKVQMNKDFEDEREAHNASNKQRLNQRRAQNGRSAIARASIQQEYQR